jgi:hypothetical protein
LFLFGYRSVESTGGDYTAVFAGHAVYPALFALAAGIGMRLFPIRRLYAWMPAGIVFALLCFDHGMYNWKLLHPLPGGGIQMAGEAAEFLYLLTFHGRLEIWLFPIVLIVAQILEGRLCADILGRRADLVLPNEYRPWVVNEWFAAALRLPYGCAAFDQTLAFFRRRRAFAIAALEAKRNPANRPLAQYTRLLEQRVIQEQALLLSPPRGVWFPPRAVFERNAKTWLWRMRWVLAFNVLFVLLFMLGAGQIPPWLRDILFGKIFTAILVASGLAFVAWRIYAFLRAPRLDPVASEGAAYADYHARILLLIASLASGLSPALSILMGWTGIAPGAAYLSGYFAGWIGQGGNLYSVMGLGAMGGAVEADPGPVGGALRDELEAGQARIQRLERQYRKAIAHALPGSKEPAALDLARLEALIAGLDAERDMQGRRKHALEVCERHIAEMQVENLAGAVAGAIEEFERIRAEFAAVLEEERRRIAAIEHGFDGYLSKIESELETYEIANGAVRDSLRDMWRPRKDLDWALRVAQCKDESAFPVLRLFVADLGDFARRAPGAIAEVLYEGIARLRGTPFVRGDEEWLARGPQLAPPEAVAAEPEPPEKAPEEILHEEAGEEQAEDLQQLGGDPIGVVEEASGVDETVVDDAQAPEAAPAGIEAQSETFEAQPNAPVAAAEPESVIPDAPRESDAEPALQDLAALISAFEPMAPTGNKTQDIAPEQAASVAEEQKAPPAEEQSEPDIAPPEAREAPEAPKVEAQPWDALSNLLQAIKSDLDDRRDAPPIAPQTPEQPEPVDTRAPWIAPHIVEAAEEFQPPSQRDLDRAKTLLDAELDAALLAARGEKRADLPVCVNAPGWSLDEADVAEPEAQIPPAAPDVDEDASPEPRPILRSDGADESWHAHLKEFADLARHREPEAEIEPEPIAEAPLIEPELPRVEDKTKIAAYVPVSTELCVAESPQAEPGLPRIEDKTPVTPYVPVSTELRVAESPQAEPSLPRVEDKTPVTPYVPVSTELRVRIERPAEHPPAQLKASAPPAAAAVHVLPPVAQPSPAPAAPRVKEVRAKAVASSVPSGEFAAAIRAIEASPILVRVPEPPKPPRDTGEGACDAFEALDLANDPLAAPSDDAAPVLRPSKQAQSFGRAKSKVQPTASEKARPSAQTSGSAGFRPSKFYGNAGKGSEDYDRTPIRAPSRKSSSAAAHAAPQASSSASFRPSKFYGNAGDAARAQTPASNSIRSSKFFNSGTEGDIDTADRTPMPAGATASTKSPLAEALSQYYSDTGETPPPMHAVDRNTFDEIIESGRLETTHRSAQPWSYSGVPRRGDFAIRLKRGSDRYVEFVPSTVTFGQTPRYYARRVGVGTAQTYIPIEHLEVFDTGAREWLPLRQ